MFNLYDQYIFFREDVETPGALAEEVQPRRRLHIQGKRNLLYSGAVLIPIFLLVTLIFFDRSERGLSSCRDRM